MKKLFTLLMTILVVTVCFAQNENSRDGWKGFYSQSSYNHTMPAESEYFLFLPAGTFSTQVTLEKVRFYINASANVGGYNGPEFTIDNDYYIRIYTGAHVDGLDFVPGERVRNQKYNPVEIYGDSAERGAQVVDLEEPLIVQPTDNIAVGIYSAEPSAMGLCDHDPACEALNFANWPDFGEGIHHYYWCGYNHTPAWAYQNEPAVEHDPWNLSVYYNDGTGYTNTVDIKPRLLDPDEDNYNEIDGQTFYTDPNSDAMFYRFIILNAGMEDAIGDIHLTVSIQCPTATLENLVFLDDTLERDTVPAEGLIYWSNQPWILYSYIDDDPDYPTWSMLEEDYSVSLPYDLCVTAIYTTAPDYQSVEENTDNNTYCLHIRNASELGINDNNTYSLNVNPNPASTTLSIENTAGSNIYVYSMTGQEVMSIEEAEANVTLNVSNLNAGLYIVRVVNGNEVSTAKVSIVR